MKIKNLITITFICFSVFKSNAQGFIKTNGKQIINEKGEEVILRGIGLGGWMLQEGYMLQVQKEGTQHAIKSRIADLIGTDGCNKFYDAWLTNNTTRQDIDSLAKWGYNSVRLPMHYNLYTLPIEDEPIKGKNTWIEKGFILTDSLLTWCKANKMYLILDLHAAPGGQGKDENISDYDPKKPSLWESDLNKQKTIALWRRLAERYANEPNIGGYDLINEPNWTFEGKNKNGCEDENNTPIWELYKDITKEIREVDKTHIIFIEGNCWSGNYNGFSGIWDSNMSFSFHKYWNPNNVESIQKFLDLREKYDVPLWMGESGENSNQWFVESITLFEKNHIGWSWWPLKKIGTVICPLNISKPDGYQQILDYWNSGEGRPSVEQATETLMKLTENLKVQNCSFTKDYIDAMFRQRIDSIGKPYANSKVPGKIFAVNYDLGQNGQTYSDNDFQSIGGPGRGTWNRGHLYRNDGVDIEKCDDSTSYTNNFNVSWIEKNEWMTYTLNVQTDGIYKINLRVFPINENGVFDLEIDNKLVTTVKVGTDKNKWLTIHSGETNLSKGTHILKVKANEGGIKLNFIEFVPK